MVKLGEELECYTFFLWQNDFKTQVIQPVSRILWARETLAICHHNAHDIIHYWSGPRATIAQRIQARDFPPFHGGLDQMSPNSIICS